jgi:hypothetical protein
MSKTKRRVKTEAEEEATTVSYSRDPISDATVVQPTRTTAFGLGDLRPIIDVPVKLPLYPARNVEETAEYRTRRFRATRLIRHQSGAMACFYCHFAPYYCQSCGGLKCQCKAAGVYRHWENGYPNPTMEELQLLDGLSLLDPDALLRSA